MPKPRPVITLPDYWMGRDSRYRGELSLVIQSNAQELVSRVNALTALMVGVDFELAQNGSLVTSGWRPEAVNAVTPGAAPKSKHMLGQAIDLYDPDGDIDEWCMANQQMLETFGLWLEHPSATKGWCHLQSVPPKSLKRVFYP